MGGLVFGGFFFFSLCCGQLRFGVWILVGIILKTEVWALQHFPQVCILVLFVFKKSFRKEMNTQ